MVYGQGHLTSDEQPFVFTLKVAENTTMYGVCVYVSELIQRQPAMVDAANAAAHAAGGAGAGAAGGSGGSERKPLSRYLVAAPRCYCLLTRVPFFQLHFEVLHSILGMERLELALEPRETLHPAPPHPPPNSRSLRRLRRLRLLQRPLAATQWFRASRTDSLLWHGNVAVHRSASPETPSKTLSKLGGCFGPRRPDSGPQV